MVSRFLLLSALLVISATAATIQSVPGGGNWNDTLTWVEFHIPGENDDVIINGTVSVTGSAACNNLTISQSAVFQNGGSLGWVVPSIKGDLINNGTIRNNPTANTIELEIYGNITNNGTWTPDRTCVSSSKQQTISQATGTEFRSWFTRKNYYGTSDTFALVAGSDIVFNLDGYGYDGMGYKTTAPNYFWSVFDLAHHNLTLKGGTAFGRAVLWNTATLAVQDSSTLYDLSFRDAVTLTGAATITNANVTFNGTTTVQGILQNGGSLGWLAAIFNGTLINNGTIRSNPKGNTFNLNTYGDIVNNGTWTPGTAYFGSKRKQTISQQAGTQFQGNFKRSNSDGYTDTFDLAAGSDLTLNLGTYEGMGYKTVAPNYFWAVLDMAHHNLTLKGGTTFGRADLRNSATITSLDSSSMYDLSVRDSVTLAGTTTFTNGNVYIYGLTTVADTLQNGGGLGWFTIQTYGGLYNRGVIRNNPRGNVLDMAVGRDIRNAGSWKIDHITLIDSVNQKISLINGAPIQSKIHFQALWTSGPYQWQRADTNWGGGNKELSFDSLTLAAAGVYRCKKGDSVSRTFTVQNDIAAITQPGKGDTRAPAMPKAFSWKMFSSKSLRMSIAAPAACTYDARLYTLRGLTAAVKNGTVPAGYSLIAWDRTIAPGAYLVRLKVGPRSFQKQVMITGR